MFLAYIISKRNSRSSSSVPLYVTYFFSFSSHCFKMFSLSLVIGDVLDSSWLRFPRVSVLGGRATCWICMFTVSINFGESLTVSSNGPFASPSLPSGILITCIFHGLTLSHSSLIPFLFLSFFFSACFISYCFHCSVFTFTNPFFGSAVILTQCNFHL